MLDLHLQSMLQQAQAAGIPDFADLPPPIARQVYRQILAAADRPPADVHTADRHTGGPAPVPVRVYTPREPGPHALVVYYHGGGYVMGDLDGYDGVCRQLCEDSGAVVVSVDYQLAPEHPFPAAVDDAWAALCWAAGHAAELGADPARLAVAGDSAGAVLATVATMLARDAGGPAIVMQALVYPPAGPAQSEDFPSRRKHGAGPTLTQRSMDSFTAHYIGPTPADYRVAPLLAPSLAKLPSALVLLAGHDPLRDEGLAYGEALMAAGTPAQIVEYHGLAHGFISVAGAIPAARQAQRQLGQALRDGLKGAVGI